MPGTTATQMRLVSFSRPPRSFRMRCGLAHVFRTSPRLDSRRGCCRVVLAVLARPLRVMGPVRETMAWSPPRSQTRDRTWTNCVPSAPASRDGQRLCRRCGPGDGGHGVVVGACVRARYGTVDDTGLTGASRANAQWPASADKQRRPESPLASSRTLPVWSRPRGTSLPIVDPYDHRHEHALPKEHTPEYEAITRC